MQISEMALKHSPWSMSKAKLAKNCSLAHHLQYIQKAKGLPPKDSAGRVGNAAHLALEKYLKGADKPLKDLLFDSAMDYKLTTTEIDDLVSYAHNITRFRERFEAYRVRNKIVADSILIEHKFGLRADLVPTKFYGVPVAPESKQTDVFFRGVMDMVMRSEEGYVAILDHKSGSPASCVAEAMERHGDQLKLYTIAALAMYPDLRGVFTGLHYLQSEEIVWGNRGEPVMPATIRGELSAWFYKFLEEAAIAAESAIAKTGWHCKFCGFTAQCPLKHN